MGPDSPNDVRRLHQPVMEAVLSIAHALRSPVDDIGPGRPPVHAVNVSDGSAGTALLFTYLSLASRREPALGDPGAWRDVALAHLSHAAGGVASLPMSPGLFAGFTGVVWAMAHIGGALDVELDATDEIDEVLLNLVRAPRRLGDYDLVSGLVGIGVHALERLPDPMAERCLGEILARLEESAQRDVDGVVWHTPSARLASPQRETWPGGIFDLGVAHGLAGVIAFLAECHAAGVAVTRTRRLLDEAVSWLLAHSLPPAGAGGFPWASIPGVEPRPTRSAWCYGDPGVAAALQRASECAGEPAWAARARGLALGVAARKGPETRVEDVGICHGGAGLLHILGRLYQACGEPALRDAACAWLAWVLDARGSGEDSIAGFRALTYTDGSPVWIPERGLINGAAGVGLALLATISEASPSWDRILLLSGREHAGPSPAHAAGRV